VTHQVVLIGGAQDVELCDRIANLAASLNVVSLAGRLSFLSSAALIDRASVLVSNDSAPVHIASAMGTPVVEIFGATSPDFGFTPYGVAHRIVQREDLDCKPCAIHGGDHCPVKTFDCMEGLSAHTVIEAVHALEAPGNGG
jgi:heptosyltransferase-2